MDNNAKIISASNLTINFQRLSKLRNGRSVPASTKRLWIRIVRQISTTRFLSRTHPPKAYGSLGATSIPVHKIRRAGYTSRRNSPARSKHPAIPLLFVITVSKASASVRCPSQQNPASRLTQIQGRSQIPVSRSPALARHRSVGGRSRARVTGIESIPTMYAVQSAEES